MIIKRTLLGQSVSALPSNYDNHANRQHNYSPRYSNQPLYHPPAGQNPISRASFDDKKFFGDFDPKNPSTYGFSRSQTNTYDRAVLQHEHMRSWDKSRRLAFLKKPNLTPHILFLLAHNNKDEDEIEAIQKHPNTNSDVHAAIRSSRQLKIIHNNLTVPLPTISKDQ